MPHTQFLALAVALLFVSHPVQTEAVTYVFQRLTSLVSMFYLLSLVLYIKARLESHRAEGIVQGAKGSRRSLLYALCSLLAAVLAMKTKENAFTLPVVITLYEFLFFTGALRRRLLRLAPFLLTMLIIPVSIMQIEGSLGETMKPMTEPAALGYENLSGTEYFFTQFRVIVTYLRLLLCPVNQNVVYDYPIYNSLFELPVLLSFLVLSALFGTAVYLVYKTRSAKSIEHRAKSIEHGEGPSALRSMPWAIGPLRLVAFGILWFFITLSVESSVIPLAMVIDEYRVYLPSAGFFLASAGCASLLWRPRGMSLKIPFTAFLVIILTLSYATYARNSLWTDKVRLWEDVARKNPDSPKVYNNLGIAYYEKGRYDKAIDMYERAVSLSPGNYFAYSNLATAYAVTGRLDRAIDNFRKAIALDPGNGVVYSNLGHALRKLGRFAEAAEVYLKAVTLNPYDGAAFYGLGAACASLGRLDDALNAYSRFAELSPRDPEAYRGRGNVYAKKGDMSRAEADFRKACSLGSVEGCAKLRNIR
ncbi:MAG: tetratricopeptide repeat protein [Nitrospirae bacterium]|nr:tetratricopeptide repeat protein [Nitrospirota bacterium]